MGHKKNAKKTAAKNKNRIPAKKKGFSGDWTGGIMQIYLAVMLGVFPLYYHDNLFNIGTEKYIFFRTATLIMLALLAAELVSRFAAVRNHKNAGRQQSGSVWVQVRGQVSGWSFTDIAVLAYALLAVLSWLLSEWRAEAWIGAGSWYMGLLSQLLLAGIYFAVSRFCPCREWMLWVTAGSGAAVFLIAYLHRFSIDPLGLMDESFGLLYLGTIGQATLHSAYVCITLSFMMGAYIIFWREHNKKARLRRRLAAAVIFLGFCTAVTQNSDSIYVGLGTAFLFLLWFALEDGAAWRRYVEIVLLASLAAKFTGILQNLFPERVPSLDALSFMVTKGKAGWLVLTAAAAAYAATCLLQKKSGGEESGLWAKKLLLTARRFRTVFYALAAVLSVGLLILVWLVTAGKLSLGEGVLQRTGYLYFDERWGSGRGSIWILSACAFAGFPLFRKLFGCGPDMLGNYLKTYHGEMLRSQWGDRLMRNAHNEWLNAVIDYGIIGGAAYIAIFAGGLIRMIKKRNMHPVLLAMGTSILSYMTHDIFCYQQAVCAPLVFIMIGMAEGLMRTDQGKAKNM